jgi:hypothetical protein
MNDEVLRYAAWEIFFMSCMNIALLNKRFYYNHTTMIEQISQNMTHVLKAGDPIGAFTVKEILQDRAVLQMGEQEIELF